MDRERGDGRTADGPARPPGLLSDAHPSRPPDARHAGVVKTGMRQAREETISSLAHATAIAGEQEKRVVSGMIRELTAPFPCLSPEG